MNFELAKISTLCYTKSQSGQAPIQVTSVLLIVCSFPMYSEKGRFIENEWEKLLLNQHKACDVKITHVLPHTLAMLVLFNAHQRAIDSVEMKMVNPLSILTDFS